MIEQEQKDERLVGLELNLLQLLLKCPLELWVVELVILWLLLLE